MNEIVSFNWGFFLLGLIFFLLILITTMLRKIIILLTEFQDRLGQTDTSKIVEYSRERPDMECTEEELAVITAVLTKLMPDKKLNIVNLKLIQ